MLKRLALSLPLVSFSALADVEQEYMIPHIPSLVEYASRLRGVSQVQVTDRDGEKLLTYKFDSKGRLVEALNTENSWPWSLDRYVYDDNGLLEKRIEYSQRGADDDNPELQLVSTHTYRSDGKLESMKRHRASGELINETSLEYNGEGRPIRRVSRWSYNSEPTIAELDWTNNKLRWHSEGQLALDATFFVPLSSILIDEPHHPDPLFSYSSSYSLENYPIVELFNDSFSENKSRRYTCQKNEFITCTYSSSTPDLNIDETYEFALVNDRLLSTMFSMKYVASNGFVFSWASDRSFSSEGQDDYIYSKHRWAETTEQTVRFAYDDEKLSMIRINDKSENSEALSAKIEFTYFNNNK